MKKRLPAILLAFAIVLTLLPAAALAEAEPYIPDNPEIIIEPENASAAEPEQSDMEITDEKASSEEMPSAEKPSEADYSEVPDTVAGEEDEAEPPAGEESAEKTPEEAAFDAETEYGYIVTLDPEDAQAYYNTLTAQQQEELRAYAERLNEAPEADNETEPTDPENAEGVVSGPATVAVTDAAPLCAAIQNAAKKMLMKANKAPLGAAPAADDGNGLYLSKTAEPCGNGEFKLTLEAYTTGTVKTETSSIPADIVLVLDQSGSMTSSYTRVTTASYNKITFNNNALLSLTRNLFIKLDNGEFSRVEVNWFFGYYSYTWTDETGSERSTGSVGSALNCPWEIQGKLYQQVSTSADVSRLDALKNAAAAFIGNVQADAAENHTDHRVAVVGFASDKTNYNNSAWENTELLSAQSVISYPNITAGNYTSALVSANVNGNVNPRLTTAINRLDASGGTYINYGIEMAQGIFNNTDGEGRRRVVVILTDGVPGNGSWGNTVSGNACASDALSKAAAMKNAGVTVYTIGIFDGADATSAGSNSGTTAQKTNYFMQQLSSNNGTVGMPSYYLSAGDYEELNRIFQSISRQISTPTISLGASTIVRDTLTQYFEIPESAEVSLYTAPCVGGDMDSGFTFGERTAYTPDAEDVRIDYENGVVDVSGFNFDDSFCSLREDGTYQGEKLIIEMRIAPKEAFWGGNGVPTNITADSGVYSGGESVEKFPVPDPVDVPVKMPEIDGNTFNIYYGGELPIDALYTTNVPETSDWRTDYVEIELLCPGELSNTEDGVYDVSVKVKPVIEGTQKEKTAADTVKVDVFRPYFALAARDVWADYAAEIELTQWALNNMDTPNVVWRHGETVSDSVTMLGSAPTVSDQSYTFAKINGDGSLSDGIYTTGEQDSDFDIIGMRCKLGDEDYIVPAADITVIRAVGGEDHTFTVHINRFKLTIVKTETGEEIFSQDHIFTVSDGIHDYQLVIHGSESRAITGLVCGRSYTVSEDGNWSWRYRAADSQTVCCTTGSGGISSSAPAEATLCRQLEVENALDVVKWLSSKSSVNNR